MKVLLSNIQRFSLQDGSGIRTTIFFKGCLLHCPWCSNPENISNMPEKYVHDGITKQFGYEMSLAELEKEILKDIQFYKSGGGVTYSGGEALLQMPFLEKMLISLKDKFVNQCIETSLYAPRGNLEIACKYIDEFIVDAKILDPETAKQIIGCDVKKYLENFQYLYERSQKILLRVPLVAPYTTEERNLYKIRKLIEKYNIEMIEIFRVHNLGEKKYEALNKKQDIGQSVSDNQLLEIKKYLGGEKVRIITL